MTQYRKGDAIVEAVQFDPQSHQWPEGVISWDQMPYRPRDMSWGYIETAEGKAHILTGDWIITDEAGKHLFSDPVFKAEYEPVSEKIAGSFVMGDGLLQGYVSLKTTHPIVASPPPTLNGADIDIIRALVKTAVDNALYPGGTISGHEHRRVEMSDQDGKRWRGVLYRVDGHATDPMLPVAKEE